MPKMVNGYYTKDGHTTEHEMYAGDLKDAVEKFPHEWSRTPKGISAAKKSGKVGKVKRSTAKKPGKKATKPELNAPSNLNPLGTAVKEAASTSP